MSTGSRPRPPGPRRRAVPAGRLALLALCALLLHAGCAGFEVDGGLEAEDAALRGPATAGEDAGASGGGYVAFGDPTRAPLPAFPGAEGFGSTTVGGRGGRVLEVTNLADDGPGSFRAAVEADGPRIVVFRTGGTIVLDDDIKVTAPYLTIAGQTAPGGGITLRSNPELADSGLMDIHTHDVVIRSLRFRSGTFRGENEGNPLTIYKAGTYNVVIDHSSFSWGVNENLTTYDHGRDITLSWNVISEALGQAGHPEGEHSRGLFMSGVDSRNISAHHNLIAHNNKRNPEINMAGTADFVNNVVYDWGERAGLTSDKNGGLPLNFVGNWFEPGPDSATDGYELEVYHRDDECRGTLRIHARGNIGPNRPTGREPEDRVIEPDDCFASSPSPHPAPPVTTTSAAEARDDVLAGAGVRVPAQDAVDRRVVADVRNGTGGLIDRPEQVGGWPTLARGIAPADADHDGMPDGWESPRGLDPGRDDSAGDRNGDGYTNVEEYVNGLMGAPPMATCPAEGGVGTASTTVDVPASGTVRVWSRLRAPSGASAGHVVRVDGQCRTIAAGPGNGEWTWATASGGGSAGGLPLTAGRHQVTLIGTEPGVQVDRLLLTADPACRPRGQDGDCA